MQKRVVYGYLDMFGDVGGLNDFLSIVAGGIFGIFSEGFRQAYMAEKLFHQQEKTSKSKPMTPKQTISSLKQLKFSNFFILFSPCLRLSSSKAVKKKRKLLDEANQRIEASLDILNFIR